MAARRTQKEGAADLFCAGPSGAPCACVDRLPSGTGRCTGRRVWHGGLCAAPRRLLVVAGNRRGCCAGGRARNDFTAPFGGESAGRPSRVLLAAFGRARRRRAGRRMATVAYCGGCWPPPETVVWTTKAHCRRRRQSVLDVIDPGVQAPGTERVWRAPISFTQKWKKAIRGAPSSDSGPHGGPAHPARQHSVGDTSALGWERRRPDMGLHVKK